jgi:two-component system response regulator HydG
LFYRLNAVSIVLPPLRERREDILPLAKSFAEQVYSLNPAVTFAPDALRLMGHYPWPGNIRELENAVVRAAAMCDGTIRVVDLPERVRNYRAEVEVVNGAEPTTAQGAAAQDWPSLGEVEGRYVARVLEHTGGNKQAAARLLGVDRKTVERIVRRQNPASDRIREAS